MGAGRLCRDDRDFQCCGRHRRVDSEVVNGLGDGLAEPVGIKWGKHKYQTRAIWYHGKVCSGEFVRSLEGSACVFMSGMVFPCTFYTSFANEVQMWMAIAILPPQLASWSVISCRKSRIIAWASSPVTGWMQL